MSTGKEHSPCPMSSQCYRFDPETLTAVGFGDRHSTAETKKGPRKGRSFDNRALLSVDR